MKTQSDQIALETVLELEAEVQRLRKEIAALRDRISEYEEPGKIGARFKMLEELAAPMGYTTTDGAPVELFVQLRIAKLERAVADYEASFNLRWKSDMRAIKLWQKAHPGNDLVWTDHAELCVWLMEQLEKNNEECNYRKQ